MPSLITHYEVYSGGANNNTLTTPSFTPSNGEVLVVKLNTWDTANGMNAPTGGSQTFVAAPGAVAPGGFNGWVGIWVATVSGSPGSMTVSAAPATAGNTQHAMVVERWSGAKLAATPASSNTTGVNSLPSNTLTTTAANSVISWVISDAQSINPATRAYLLSGVEDGLFDGHVGANGVFYFAYSGAGAVTSATSYTYGMSAPGGQIWVMAGVEILDSPISASAPLPSALIGPGQLAPGARWSPQQFPQFSGAGPVRASATGTANGTTNVTVPSTVVPGDMLVAVVSLKNTVGSATITPPTGWNLLDGPVNMTGATGMAATYTKVASSSDVGATQTWTISTTQQCCVVVTAVMGASATPRAHNLTDNGVTASAAVTCGSATAQMGDVVLLLGGVRGSTTGGQPSFTAPYNFTVDGQTTTNSGSAQNMAAFVVDGRLYGATAESVTASVSSWSIAGQIVLQPGTASPSGPTQYSQTLTAAVAAGPKIVRQAGVTKAVVAAAARALVRRVTTSRSATVTLTRALVRRVGGPRPAAVTSAPAVGRRVGAKRSTSVAAARLLTRALTIRRTTGVTASTSVRRRVGRTLTGPVSLSAAIRVGRVLLRTLTAAVTAAAVLVRRVAARRPVAATMTLTRSGRTARSLTVVAHSASTLARRIGKHAAAVTVGTSSLARRVGRRTTTTVVASAGQVSRRVRLLALVVAVTLSPKLARRLSTVRAAAVTAGLKLTRRVDAPRMAAVATSPVLLRRIARHLTTAMVAAAVQSTRRVRLLTLAAAVTGTGVLRRRVGKPLVRAVAASTSLRRRSGKRAAVAAAVSPALVRRAARNLAVTVHAAPAVVVTRVAILALHAAVAVSAALRRQPRTVRAAAVSASGSVRRRIGASRAAHATTAGVVHRRVGKSGAVTASATPTVRRDLAVRRAIAVHALATAAVGRLYMRILATVVAVAAAATTATVAVRQIVFTFGRIAAKWAAGLLLGHRWALRAPTWKWTIGGPKVLTYSVLSKELVQVTVSATSGGAPVNPTGDTVRLAFVAAGTSPGSGDWHNGTWDTAVANGVYTAQCLIGPGSGAALTAGVYDVWVTVVDNPEVPVRQVGQIQVV